MDQKLLIGSSLSYLVGLVPTRSRNREKSLVIRILALVPSSIISRSWMAQNRSNSKTYVKNKYLGSCLLKTNLTLPI